MINAKIELSNKYLKQLGKAPLNIRSTVADRLELFIHDPMHPLLKNHLLKGVLSGFRSINITGDWRLIYREEKRNGETVIIFEALGTHSQLYE